VVDTLFSCEQEKQLVDRIRKITKCVFPVVLMDVMRAVYKCAIANNKHKFPSKMARKYSLTGFNMTPRTSSLKTRKLVVKNLTRPKCQILFF
jgi:hypothetical protein